MNKKYGFVAQLEEHCPEKTGVDDSISSEATNIKVGDYIEFGEREWATWRLVKITGVYPFIYRRLPHVSGPRTTYHYEVLACNKDKSGWTPSLKGKFYSGAPVFESPMKKVKFTELPLYISAPHKTSWFAEILKSPS